MKELSKVIGIISYLPDDNVKSYTNKSNVRGTRAKYIQRLIDQINIYFPDLPVIIIAQNWGDLSFDFKNKTTLYKYKNKLGILGARNKLRQVFLDSGYDYLIMMDDDTQIAPGDVNQYLKEIDQHPDGAGLNGKFDYYLGLFAISKYAYNKIELPEKDVEQSGILEDIYLTEMCKRLIPNCFTFSGTLFDKSIDGTGAYSTWWKRGYSLSAMKRNTYEYINSKLKE